MPSGFVSSLAVVTAVAVATAVAVVTAIVVAAAVTVTVTIVITLLQQMSCFRWHNYRRCNNMTQYQMTGLIVK